MMHGTVAHSTLGASERTSHSPSPVAWLRRFEMILVASLSIGAGVIHLAAASSHLELLGDLALGFYWAALFQVAFAVAFLARSGSHHLARVGVAVNLVLIGAWAWSRTVGLPMIPGGPEAIGLADGTTVGLQVLLVALLTARHRGSGRAFERTPTGGVPARDHRLGVRRRDRHRGVRDFDRGERRSGRPQPRRRRPCPFRSRNQDEPASPRRRSAWSRRRRRSLTAAVRDETVLQRFRSVMSGLEWATPGPELDPTRPASKEHRHDRRVGPRGHP